MRRLVLPLVALVALVIRLVPALVGPGLLDWGRYDDGVYYTAAASLIDGRMPYRDFVLLHPPLIALMLAPFALLGRLTTDPIGWMTARVVWMLVGTASAVLAAKLAGRWGAVPAIVAGLWVACSSAATYASRTTFIEPVADLALLGALILLTCDRERPRHELIAGLLLGISLTGKIWYVVPVATVLVVMLVHRRFRSALRAGAVAALVAAIVLLPFFLTAPREMWHMVVYDQLTRPAAMHASFLGRLGVAVAGRYLGLGVGTAGAIAIVAALVALVGVVGCLLERQARIVGAVAVVNVLVLLVSPSNFRHYGSLSAAPVAVALAVGWASLGPRLVRVRWLRLAGVGVAVAATLTGGVLVATLSMGMTYPTTALRSVLPPGCITADNPGMLIVTDRLSSDLRAGCQVAVDVTGASYGVRERRDQNGTYLAWLKRYLASGSAMIVQRRTADGLVRPDLKEMGDRLYQDDRIDVIVPAPQDALLTPGP